MSTPESRIVDERPTGRQGGIVVGTDYASSNNFFQVPLERLRQADPKNVQEIAASQIALLSNYHREVLDQAKKSFLWALLATGIGLIFFLSAIGFVIYRQATQVAIISAIGGVLIEFIAGINFYLYGKTASQMAEFQFRLDVTQRFLLANSMCESLAEEYKHKTRSELIKKIVAIDFQPSDVEVDSSVKKDNSKNQQIGKE